VHVVRPEYKSVLSPHLEREPLFSHFSEHSVPSVGVSGFRKQRNINVGVRNFFKNLGALKIPDCTKVT
jgi:hypothetical protein